MSQGRWNAVVLAGDRDKQDSLIVAANVESKAQIEIDGVMLIEKVLTALADAKSIDNIFVVSSEVESSVLKDSLARIFTTYSAKSLLAAQGPCASAIRGVEVSKHYPTLIITSDLPLICAEHIDNYCASVESIDADFVITAIPHDVILQTVPSIKKTTYKLNRQSMCFANLFALKTSTALNALNFWQDVESKRKSPIKLIASIAWQYLLSYAFGRLSLNDVGVILSKQSNASIKLANIACAELAIDIDTKEDYKIIREHLSRL